MCIISESNTHARGKNLFLIIVFLALLVSSLFVRAAPPAQEQEATLTVLTYNVLAHTNSFVDHIKSLIFNTPLPSDRISPMVDLLTRENADVIALQEVTHPLLMALQNAPGLSSYNIESTLPPPATGWRRYLSKAAVFLLGYQPWGQVILSKWPITEVRSYPLYGRSFLVSRIAFGELSITVGTCHLSSFAKEHQTRMKQLKEAFRILGSAQHAILLGDFNFGNSAPENTALPSAYRDVWQALRPNNPGYTYDTKTNTRVVQKAAPGKASQRIDRILVRSTALAPTSVELLGVAPVMYKNMPMHLSDHYGVLASLRLRRNSARSSVD